MMRERKSTPLCSSSTDSGASEFALSTCFTRFACVKGKYILAMTSAQGTVHTSFCHHLTRARHALKRPCGSACCTCFRSFATAFGWCSTLPLPAMCFSSNSFAKCLTSTISRSAAPV